MTTPGVLERKTGLRNGEEQRISELQLQIHAAGGRFSRDLTRSPSPSRLRLAGKATYLLTQE